MDTTSTVKNATPAPYPSKVLHWRQNKPVESRSGRTFAKLDPDTGQGLADVAEGDRIDAREMVTEACGAFPMWSQTPIVRRADLLRAATQQMEQRKQEIASIVSWETGKSAKDALGEVSAAVEMGYFIAGEGRRYYGRTTTSATPYRSAMTIRQPVGVCGLIIAANTPIANVAWKVYPALLCGNTAVLKPSEDTPYTAHWFAERLSEVGVPPGVLSVLQGHGEGAGAPLVEDHRVDLISFTGSEAVGRYVQRVAGERLAKVCLELGGKNALVVCDDADLDMAAQAALLSAFSNAGQRCAAGSRIVVFQSVYEEFKRKLIEKTARLRLGKHDEDDLGPVINESQLNGMARAVGEAVRQGARLLAGGGRLTDGPHCKGFYMAPTILEQASPEAPISRTELFGPITCLYPVKDFGEALGAVNDSSYGLTAAIHTRSIHRAMRFQDLCRTGVISINGPTYGSEPHMPFGGLKNSGNGFREAGTEALDVYSEWKTIYSTINPEAV